MKKVLSLILVISILSCCTFFSFADTRAVNYSRSMNISGTRISCKCSAWEEDAYLTITMKLYQDGRVVETWYDSGYDLVSLNEWYEGISGSTYKLSVNYTVNGTRTSIPSITKVCP